MLAISNPPKVALPSKTTEVILIPDTSPVIAVYHEFFEDGEKIPSKDIIIIETINDFKNWLADNKQNLRIKINMLISILLITISLYVFFGHSKYSKKMSE